MKTGIIAFTNQGCETGKRIAQGLAENGHEVNLFVKSKYFSQILQNDVIPVEEALQAWTGKQMEAMDFLVFVGATGIAVRAIAPFVADKKSDPGILVVDVKGQYVIPLLSGHLGGANALAKQVAKDLGAQAILTTATDVNQLFAVDVFAKKNHMYISDMKLAKKVSALLLEKKALHMGAGSAFRIDEKSIPGELIFERKESPDGTLATVWFPAEEQEILHLIPKNIVLGIGCKKDTPAEKIENRTEGVLKQFGIRREAVFAVASIDLKKEEKGLLEFCRKYDLPFFTFSADKLRQVKGEFSASSFVSSVTGVDNVCERSAVLAASDASGKASLLIKKQAKDGVTIAVAVRDWSVEFE